jgi:hypothetical protein
VLAAPAHKAPICEPSSCLDQPFEKGRLGVDRRALGIG